MDVDVIIRGGTVVDGTGAPARRADVAIAGDRIVAVEPDLSAGGARVIDADRPGRDARVRRRAHAPRRPARLGSAADVVVLARHHERGAGQLRRHVRAGRPRSARVPRRDDGERRGHPARGHPRRPAVGLDDLRRLSRLARPHADGHQRRWPRGPLRDACGGDGRPCPRRGVRHARRHRQDVRDGRGGPARRRPWHLDEPHARPRRARRPPGAGHVRRRRRAARVRRGPAPHRPWAVRGRDAPRRARRRGADQDPRRGGRDGRDQPPLRPPRLLRVGPIGPPTRPVLAGDRLHQGGERLRCAGASADDRAWDRDHLLPVQPHAVGPHPGVEGAPRAARRRSAWPPSATPSGGPGWWPTARAPS